MDLVEASIADLQAALESGRVTSVELVAGYLERIGRYDWHGTRLNAVPVLDPSAFEAARASDDRRTAGRSLGPLDGIPYTVKDSFAVRGLSLAAGSPAFRDLVATTDAFTVQCLRTAGAVLLGRTTMPPMANGGMQRGLYGRAESPYNPAFLTAAFASGSSNGSGTATAAGFAAFGLAEETWSSGRAPASNNGLVAYTPSRGVISVRGNWPLVPTMDVVVPHTRTMADLLQVLDVIVADDDTTRGDFWRTQPWVAIPAASAVRPPSYPALADPDGLRGRRLGVPRMYIDADVDAPHPIETRPSVVACWQAARRDLESLGAEVVEVDFPVVSNQEKDRPGALSMVDRGLVPPEFETHELWELSMLGWHDFLDANGQPGLSALAEVDGPLIFPQPAGSLPDRYDGDEDFDLAEYVTRARTSGIVPLEQIPTIEEGLRGLEATRRVDLEQWMTDTGLDAVVFPAVADVGPADADVNEASAVLAWRNGTWVANGNLVIRHLGIPTVTVPMGLMADIGMPVGLTFAGRAYDDSALLTYASAFESLRDRRVAPLRTPELTPEAWWSPAPTPPAERTRQAHDIRLAGHTVEPGSDGRVRLTVAFGVTPDDEGLQLRASLNGIAAPVTRSEGGYVATGAVSEPDLTTPYSEWLPPHPVLAVVTVRDPTGAVTGQTWMLQP